MITFDTREFERKAKQLAAAADQVPFALANALTTAAFDTRKTLVMETWPGAVTVRQKSFIKVALKVKKARKADLSVEISDEGVNGRGHLKLHADSGTKQANGRLAIPPSGSAIAASRGPKGIPKGNRPAAIIARTDPRALRITPAGIFVGEGGSLHLVYSFAAKAAIAADVPFRENFATSMRHYMTLAFPKAMSRAMATRRPR